MSKEKTTLKVTEEVIDIDELDDELVILGIAEDGEYEDENGIGEGVTQADLDKMQADFEKEGL